MQFHTRTSLLVFCNLDEVGNFKNLAFGGSVIRLNGNVADFSQAKRSGNGNLVFLPVSYTHLDVYKRQG